MATDIDPHEKCKRCGHAWSFHGKAMKTECKAMGCKGGPRGKRCQGFAVKPVRRSSNAPKG
jgi:hypothetical protein